MAGENCRSGCRERNHATYGECLRAARVTTNLQVTPKNSWDRELEAYRRARQEGIQPASTSERDSLEAMAFSDKYGTAFDAGDKVSTLARAGLLPDGADVTSTMQEVSA